jgi:hypothetical protein
MLRGEPTVLRGEPAVSQQRAAVDIGYRAWRMIASATAGTAFVNRFHAESDRVGFGSSLR